MTYLILVYEFFKIGLFAIGGGSATLPFLMNLTEKYDWFTATQLTDLVAISESTPGPLGVNMATFAGYHAAGIPGAILATLSLVFPSVVIILIIAKFLENFSKNQTVQSIFYGIRPAVAGLIAVAVYELLRISLIVMQNGKTSLRIPVAIMCLVVLVLLQVKQLKKLHPGIWLLGAAIVGVVLRL
ncbi:MAG: chromate transporter [Clostridiales bacterium]|nr:chromate transporter [Clostridiales bacterium]